MKDILAKIEAAKKKLVAAEKIIDGIKEADLAFLKALASQVKDLLAHIEQVKSKIHHKQDVYFDLLTRCTSEIVKSCPSGVANLLRDITICENCTVISPRGDHRGYDPHGIPLDQFTKLCEHMIIEITSFPHQLPLIQEDIDVRTQAVLELRKKILEIPDSAAPVFASSDESLMARWRVSPTP